MQIEIGCDATDIWLVFNKSTPNVQMTHAEARVFIEEFSKILSDAMVPAKIGEIIAEEE